MQFHPLTTTGLAPMFILIVLNLRICRGIRILHQRRTSRNRKELNMAYVAIVIVSLFVLTNMPRQVKRKLILIGSNKALLASNKVLNPFTVRAVLFSYMGAGFS